MKPNYVDELAKTSDQIYIYPVYPTNF